MSASELIDIGGKLVGYVGVSSRPVIVLNGKVYEQSIAFGDEPPTMYEVADPTRAAHVLELAKKN